ncbi:MAG: conjugal transfer protein TrbC [Firmicutes bacterium]|nr:conjugal transfer protein TrbC [Bacillota bacterium]
MNSIMRNGFEKVKGFVKSNKKELLQVGFMAVTVFGPTLLQGGCEAATSELNSSMPWHNGVSTLTTELAGPLPKIAGVIAVALSGAMMAFGEMQGMTKKSIQVVFGLGIAISAASLVSVVTGSSVTTASCLF